MKLLESVRIVLVGTQHPGNIGSSARAMKTMGLSQLILVAPQRFPDPEALTLAAGAEDVVNNARVVATLDEALLGCTLVIGTSARAREVSLPELDPRSASQQLIHGAQNSSVALLFGPERTGLENQHLQVCHACVRIPSNPEYSSLNLASAVQVLSYELRLRALQHQDISPINTTTDNAELPASFEQMQLLFGHLAEFMDEVDFHKGKPPERAMQRFRRIFLKAQLDTRELKIVRGLLSDAQRILQFKNNV